MNNYGAPGQQPYSPYGYPPPLSPYEMAMHKQPLRRWANVIGVGLLLVHGIMFVLAMLLGLIFYNPMFFSLGDELHHLMEQTINLVTHSVSFWVPTLIVLSRIKIPPSVAFPLRRPKMSILIPGVGVCLGASVLGSIASSIISAIFQSSTGLTPTMPDMSMPMGLGANIVYVVSMVVSPAVFEELMFRGVIMQSLRRFGDGFALVVSSILFGFIHGNLIQGPNAILLGLVIGYFVMRTGSIITGMVMHATINGLSVVFTYLGEYLEYSQYEILNMAVFAGYAILGCAGLVFLLVKHSGMFHTPRSDYPLPNGKKYSTFFTAGAQILFIIATVLLTSLYFN